MHFNKNKKLYLKSRKWAHLSTMIQVNHQRVIKYRSTEGLVDCANMQSYIDDANKSNKAMHCHDAAGI